MSTVLDVGLTCLLITSSAVLLVSLPDGPSQPPDADRTGRALLPATVTLQHEGHPVRTAVSDVLVTAVTDGQLPEPVRNQVRTLAESTTPTAQIAATGPGRSRPVTIGPTPPPGAGVDAAVFRIGGIEQDTRVVITVRTWSR